MIQWTYIPEHAPQFGGLWESTVKSIKTHLRKILGEAKLTFEEYCTVLSQVETCLNSRPLVPLDSDEDSIEALTPGNFLVGRPLEVLLDPPTTFKSKSLRHRWNLRQTLMHHFWKCWSTDYFASLFVSSPNGIPRHRIWKSEIWSCWMKIGWFLQSGLLVASSPARMMWFKLYPSRLRLGYTRDQQPKLLYYYLTDSTQTLVTLYSVIDLLWLKLALCIIIVVRLIKSWAVVCSCYFVFLYDAYHSNNNNILITELLCMWLVVSLPTGVRAPVTALLTTTSMVTTSSLVSISSQLPPISSLLICCGIFLNLTSSKQAEAIGVYSPTLPPIQPTYLKKICAGLFFDLKELLPDNVALIQRLNETEMLSSFSPPLSSTWTTEINNPDVLLGDWLWGHSRSSGLCSNNFSATGPKTRWLGLAHIQSALSAADGW